MAERAPKLSRERPTVAPGRSCPSPAALGSGQSLAEPTRRYFEQKFAYDFSGVRVHADSRAGEEANSLGARAFTSGNDIVFAPGEYRPHWPEGRTLLAHELAHVAQQRNGRQTSMSVPGDPAELEAAAVAERIGAGGEAGPIRAAAPAVGRQPKPGADYIEFELGTDEQGNTTANSVDVTANALWIDRKVTAAGYNIYLNGFLIWLDEASIGDVSKAIKVPEQDVVFADLKVRQINNFIYTSRADAQAAVAAVPKSTDGTLPYAYYWGAGGLLVVPTVICSTTAPKAVATMWQARVDYANFVTDALTGLAISMIGAKVLGGLYKWAQGGGGGGGTSPKPPKPPKGNQGGQKPATKPPQPAQPDPAAKPASKTNEPEPAKTSSNKPPAGEVPKNGPDLFTKTAQHPGGQAEKVKYFDQQLPGIRQRTGWRADKMGTATDGSVVYKGDKQSKALMINPKGEVYTGTWGEHVNLNVSEKGVSITVDWARPGIKKW